MVEFRSIEIVPATKSNWPKQYFYVKRLLQMVCSRFAHTTPLSRSLAFALSFSLRFLFKLNPSNWIFFRAISLFLPISASVFFVYRFYCVVFFTRSFFVCDFFLTSSERCIKCDHYFSVEWRRYISHWPFPLTFATAKHAPILITKTL